MSPHRNELMIENVDFPPISEVTALLFALHSLIHTLLCFSSSLDE
jgi:hypothetical protein